MASDNLITHINRLIGNESEDNKSSEYTRNNVARVYGQDTRSKNFNNMENGNTGSVLDIFPKVRNPLAANTSLMKNLALMDTSNLNSVTRDFLSQAAGIYTYPQAQNNNTSIADTLINNNAANTDTQQTNNKKTGSNNLGDMDIKTELPKLTEQQIATVIQKHFPNSKVISSKDANGIYQAQEETGMSALAMLGIGALESGWGTSNIANKTNNIWGYGATNDNPEGNAHRYSQMSEGAKQFASQFMNTYYNGYGAHSINSAGTGSNPKGMGYAYNDDGSISSTWAPNVSSIMNTLYNTAQSAGNFESTNSNNSNNNNLTPLQKQLLQRINNNRSIQNTMLNSRVNQLYGFNNNNQQNGVNQYYTVLPQNLRQKLTSSTNTSPLISQLMSGSTNTSINDFSGSGSNSVVNTAKSFLGTPYVWGGTTPDGFDCSGLVQYAYAQNGINIPRTSQEQFKSGKSVNKDNLQAGDLVFFKGSDGTSSAPGHVGMYIGNGQFIQAPKTGDVVKISNLSDRSDYVGARRYA